MTKAVYSPSPAGGSIPKASLPPPLSQSSPEWYAALPGKESTPMSLDALSGLALSKEMTKETKVWKNGMADWAPAGTLPEFANIFPKGPPPLVKTSPAVEWHIGVAGKDLMPFTIEDIAVMVAAGELTKETKVWKDGMKDWAEAGTLPELDGVFPKKKGPPPLSP